MFGHSKILEALGLGAGETAGGVAAPAPGSEAGPWSAQGLLAQSSAVQQLLANKKAYEKRAGSRGGAGQPVGAGGVLAARQVMDPGAVGAARVAQVTQTGPRAGLARETFDLANGMRAHVYYDHSGKRRVFVFPHGESSAQ